MKSLEMLIKIATEQHKVNLNKETLKEKVLEQARKNESDKEIKMMEIINNIIAAETNTRGEDNA